MTTFVAWGNIRQEYPLNQLPISLLSEKLRQIPKGNHRVIKRYRSRQIAHFLLWKLMQKAGIDVALLSQIYYTDSGRPEFPIECLDFNISHSGDWVAVILNIHPVKAIVGIDLEFPQKKRNFTALLQYFASTLEQAWFVQQKNAEKAFYHIWCMREAILKSQGIGIVKLSEVQHLPEERLIFSKFCPTGYLALIHDLPFYLALFQQQPFNQDIAYYQWDKQQLAPFCVKNDLVYQVNPVK